MMAINPEGGPRPEPEGGDIQKQETPEKEVSEKSAQEMISELTAEAEELEIERAHEEALAENERREENYQRALEEAEKAYEWGLKKAEQDGMLTYLGLRYFESIHGGEAGYDAARVAAELDKQKEYLKQKGIEEGGREWNKWQRRIEAAQYQKTDEFLDLGGGTIQTQEGLTWEGYPQAIQRAARIIEEEQARKKEERPELFEDPIESKYLARNREGVRKHLEGFIRAALDFGDAERAVKALLESSLAQDEETGQALLAESGFLQDKELVRELTERLRDMLHSVDETERQQAEQAIKLLKKTVEKQS